MENPLKIVLSGSVFNGAFDQALQVALSHEKNSEIPANIFCDLSGVNLIDIVSLQYILSFSNFCYANQKAFMLSLPKNDEVLDFLKSWNFFNTLEDVSKLSLNKILNNEDYKRLEEHTSSSDEREFVKLLAPDVRPERKKNFFGFFSEELSKSSKFSLPSREEGYWAQPEIIDVINNIFGEKGGDNIGSDVVSEALFNSTKHSDASIITAASFSNRYYRPETHIGSKRPFQMVVWDNGLPIYETLRKPVTELKPIREYDARNFPDRKYIVHYPQTTKKKPVYTDHKTDDHEKWKKDTQFLLGCLFPGVTSKPFADPGLSTELSGTSETKQIQRGMGFDFLLSAVIYGLGGEVSLRTGRYFANIKTSHDNERREYLHEYHKKKKNSPKSIQKVYTESQKNMIFRVSFEQFPDTYPYFHGNMVYVRV